MSSRIKRRKSFALFLTICIFFSMLSIPPKVVLADADETEVEDALVYYNFDNDAANVVDSSNNGNDGVIVGEVEYEDGYSGKAISLTGNGWVELPDNLILNNQTFTISMRFKAEQGSYGGLFGYQDFDIADEPPIDPDHVPVLSVRSDGKLYAEMWIGSQMAVVSDNAVNDGQWHRVLMTSDESSIRVYLDGEDIGGRNGLVDHISMYRNQIGSNVAWGRTNQPDEPSMNPFNGLIDDFIFYSRALDADEISTDNDITNAYLNLTEDSFEYTEDDDKDNVTQNFVVPLSGDNDVTISWSVDNDSAQYVSVDSQTGEVTIVEYPEENDQEITLIATISKQGGTSERKELKVTLKAEDSEPGPDPNFITFKYDSFSDDGRFIKNNVADFVNGRLRLTPSINNTYGSAFNSEKVSLKDERSFSTYFTFEFSQGVGWADGIVFTVQTFSNRAGTAGGGLGYQGIDESLGIEFDTWNNGSDVNDPSDNHIAINTNGDITSLSNPKVALQKNVLDLRNGIIHAWVDYDGVNKRIEVRVAKTDERPASPILSQDGLNLTNILNSDNVYVGFTAATGGSRQIHDIVSWYFTKWL